jgi:hypothetical protein
MKHLRRKPGDGKGQAGDGGPRPPRGWPYQAQIGEDSGQDGGEQKVLQVEENKVRNQNSESKKRYR